jgi:hypothetical protein
LFTRQGSCTQAAAFGEVEIVPGAHAAQDRSLDALPADET